MGIASDRVRDNIVGNLAGAEQDVERLSKDFEAKRAELAAATEIRDELKAMLAHHAAIEASRA